MPIDLASKVALFKRQQQVQLPQHPIGFADICEKCSSHFTWHRSKNNLCWWCDAKGKSSNIRPTLPLVSKSPPKQHQFVCRYKPGDLVRLEKNPPGRGVPPRAIYVFQRLSQKGVALCVSPDKQLVEIKLDLLIPAFKANYGPKSD